MEKIKFMEFNLNRFYGTLKNRLFLDVKKNYF